MFSSAIIICLHMSLAQMLIFVYKVSLLCFIILTSRYISLHLHSLFIIYSWIYSTLPKNKQVLALSATYPEYLAKHLINYMNEPAHIRLDTERPALLGKSCSIFCVYVYKKTILQRFHGLLHQTHRHKAQIALLLLLGQDATSQMNSISISASLAKLIIYTASEIFIQMSSPL